jgi:hypothetical protein
MWRFEEHYCPATTVATFISFSVALLLFLYFSLPARRKNSLLLLSCSFLHCRYCESWTFAAEAFYTHTYIYTRIYSHKRDRQHERCTRSLDSPAF